MRMLFLVFTLSAITVRAQQKPSADLHLHDYTDPAGARLEKASENLLFSMLFALGSGAMAWAGSRMQEPEPVYVISGAFAVTSLGFYGTALIHINRAGRSLRAVPREL